MLKNNDDLKEKLSSKLWKTRQQGFKDLHELLTKDPFSLSLSLRDWAKYLSDSNLQAQEQVFIVFKSFCQNNENAFDSEDGMEILIKSLLSAANKEILNLGMECFEILFQKNPKEVLISVNKILSSKANLIINVLLGFISEMLSLYGPKAIGFEGLSENLSTLLKEQSINSNVKAKILGLMKEAFRFYGEKDFQTTLSKIKKPFLVEMEDYIAKNNGNDLKEPIKFLSFEINDSKSAKWTFILNDTWINQVLDQKKTWNQRREMLDDLLVNLPNIQKPLFESLISQVNVMLKRLLNDSNLNIVIMAIKIIEKMFCYFNKEANNYAKGLLQLLVEKFKDKKSVIVEDTHKAIESLKKNLNFEEHSLRTFLFEVLDSKNSNQRINILYFLNKLINNTNFEIIFPFIKKALDDQSQEIRDMAMEKIKELCVTYGEQRVKPMVLDLPSPKLLQILNKNCENESSLVSPNNYTVTYSSIVGNNNDEMNETNNKNFENEENPIIRGFIDKFKKKLPAPPEMFSIQELEFLRMSKKMRVFQTESKKINENDTKATFDMMKMQFTQVIVKSIRDKLLDLTDKSNFLEGLVEINESMNFYLEGDIEQKTIRDGLMKFETVSDLIIKYLAFIFKSIIEKNEETLHFETCLWIIKNLQSLIKVLIQLKQNFLEFEVKYILNVSVWTFHSNGEKFEGEVFKMLEKLTFLSLNSNKMTEFFLEEFRNSHPKFWKFRDQIIKLFAQILIPKLHSFPLHLLQDYWEVISNRRIITAYKAKCSDLNSFPQFNSNFFDSLLIKTQEFKEKNSDLDLASKNFVLETCIRPEWLELCLDTLRNSSNLTSKIDALLLLNDMATSEIKENHFLFHEQTQNILTTFFITIREILIENCVSTQFPNFFLNYLQKFLASGLMDMNHPCLLWLAEEILFVLVRNDNDNIAKLLNLCLTRILEFGNIKLVTIGFWNLLLKYSKFPCYYLIFALINLSVLKIMKRMPLNDFPVFELFVAMNRFLKQSKKIINQEDPSVKTIKCLIYQLIQVKGIEVLKLVESIPDMSELFLRYRT